MQTDPIGYKDNYNLYAYVENDPVNKTDPTGLYTCNGTKEQCAQIANDIKTIKTASTSDNLSKTEQGQLKRILKTLGAAGVKNGVTINAANLGASGRGAQQEKPGDSPENDVANISLNVDKNNSSITRGGSIAHEIQHASDYISKGAANARDEALERERAAYPFNSNVYKGNDAGSYTPEDIERLSNQSADEWCNASPKGTQGCN